MAVSFYHIRDVYLVNRGITHILDFFYLKFCMLYEFCTHMLIIWLISLVHILLDLTSISHLQAAIFTSYSLRNDTEFTLYFYVPNKRPLSR